MIEVSKEQLKSREYNGKTYWTIAAPPEARGFQIPQWVSNTITDLQNRVQALEEINTHPIEDDEEIPVIEGGEEPEQPKDEIPF